MITKYSPTAPELSVIIVIVSGASHLNRCLKSLIEQIEPPSMEIIVPYDAAGPDISSVKSQFPIVKFHGVTLSHSPACAEKPSHENLDKLRAVGLKLAQGRILALLEDHNRADRSWAKRVMEAHRDTHAAVGGAIENEVDRPLNWAVYFCDFYRYHNPVKSSLSRFLSDVNISYKSEALRSVRKVWKDYYHEPFVNSALRARGETLWLSPAIIVYQHRENLTILSALHERVLWGRYYAGNRARVVSLYKRLLFVALSPLLPFLLIVRKTYNVVTKKRLTEVFTKAFPLIFILTLFWSLGECLGYVTAKPS